VTVPRKVRQKVKVKPGDVVTVEALSGDETRVWRHPRTSATVETLIGTKPASRRVPVKELEELVEVEMTGSSELPGCDAF
jgi:bifunctional DNA-binding transcriptional regulator/antitoxin component of YhaV-PrlF toxin-antitoxin module